MLRGADIHPDPFSQNCAGAASGEVGRFKEAWDDAQEWGPRYKAYEEDYLQAKAQRESAIQYGNTLAKEVILVEGNFMYTERCAIRTLVKFVYDPALEPVTLSEGERKRRYRAVSSVSRLM